MAVNFPSSNPAVVQKQPDVAEPAVQPAAQPVATVPQPSAVKPDDFKSAPPAPEKKPSTFDKLERKVIDAIKKAATKEVYKARDIDVGEVDLGGHGALKLQLKLQPVQTSDGMIQGDKHRRAISERMQATGDLTWVALGGGLYPHVGFSTSVPLGEGFNLSAGFSADASLAYSVLAPYALKPEELKTLGRNVTVDLPLDSERGKKMLEGATVRIAGEGQVAGNLGASYGVDLQQLGEFATVKAAASVGFGLSKKMGLEVVAKKLDGDKIMVQISSSEGRSRSLSTAVHLGLDSHLNNGLPQLDNKLLKMGEKEAAKALDKEIEKYTSVDLRGVHATSSSEKSTRAFVFDLSNPRAAQAYDAFVKLDLRGAQEAAADPTSGVRLMTYHQDAINESATHNWRAFTQTVLRTVNSSNVENGTLHTPEGDVTFSRAALQLEYDGLFTSRREGERTASRELVSLRRTGKPDESFYHVRATSTDDAKTTAQDVRKFLLLSKLLGATPEKMPAGLDTPEQLGKFEDTTRTVDAYVTDEGLRMLAQMPVADVISRYGDIATELNRPYESFTKPSEHSRTWTRIPWNAKDEKHYKWVMQCLSLYSEADGPTQAMLKDRYAQVTGGWNILQDLETYGQARRLTELVGKLHDAQTPRERAQLFAAAQDEFQLDVATELGTIAAITGPSEILVHELSLKDGEDDKRNITFVRGGVIEDPRPGIQAVLDDSK